MTPIKNLLQPYGQYRIAPVPHNNRWQLCKPGRWNYKAALDWHEVSKLNEKQSRALYAKRRKLFNI